jgi:hypothetical protein
MEPSAVDVDELIEFWTLLDEDRALLAGKRGATGLGFAVLLKHYSRYGRFPRGRSDVPDEVIVFVAGQLGVEAADLAFYEWSGSTIEYHRAQIRDHLGYRVATVADQEKLTGWLSEAVAHAERRPDRVREELLPDTACDEDWYRILNGPPGGVHRGAEGAQSCVGWSDGGVVSALDVDGGVPER